MADYLEVGRNTVSNYLHGRTQPSAAVLRVWALRCGVPYEWLAAGVEPEPSPTPPKVGSGAEKRASQRRTRSNAPPTKWYSDDLDGELVHLRPTG
jgi:transcriptional regulator with XRE-family HTH domain